MKQDNYTVFLLSVYYKDYIEQSKGYLDDVYELLLKAEYIFRISSLNDCDKPLIECIETFTERYSLEDIASIDFNKYFLQEDE